MNLLQVRTEEVVMLRHKLKLAEIEIEKYKQLAGFKKGDIVYWTPNYTSKKNVKSTLATVHKIHEKLIQINIHTDLAVLSKLVKPSQLRRIEVPRPPESLL